MAQPKNNCAHYNLGFEYPLEFNSDPFYYLSQNAKNGQFRFTK